MKHKVIASTLMAFNTIFDELIRRLEQVGEKIVKSRITLHHDTLDGYQAIVWTKHESKKAK